MNSSGWNHNIHYPRWILNHVPRPCVLALDLGCGTGLLVSRLAGLCHEVHGIERDHATWQRAIANLGNFKTGQILEGDFMAYPLPDHQLEMVTAVAVLHHLPLAPALTRLRDLMAAGGVLAVIGLYRAHSLVDWAWQVAAIPFDWTLRVRHGYAEGRCPDACSSANARRDRGRLQSHPPRSEDPAPGALPLLSALAEVVGKPSGAVLNTEGKAAG